MKHNVVIKVLSDIMKYSTKAFLFRVFARLLVVHRGFVLNVLKVQKHSRSHTSANTVSML